MALTLSMDEISQDVMKAFRKSFPMLQSMATDFSSKTARKGDTINARISKIPTVGTYNAGAGGYANAAVAAETLLEDVPVTLDQWPVVGLNVSYLKQLESKVDLYNEAITNHAYALGKSIIDNALSKVVAANFSKNTIETIVNTDRDTLGKVRKSMNGVGAAGVGRYGIVSSDFFEALDSDTRIASRDYHGQQTEENPMGHLKNVAGFGDIMEYPDMPAGGNLSAFFGDRRSIVIASRLPDNPSEIAAELGVPQVMKGHKVSDPDSPGGIEFLQVSWQEQGTGNVIMALTALYGCSAGMQGGAAGAITDYAGHRVVTV